MVHTCVQEKQEARIQVIAQDLDQAQYAADTLQQVLNEREAVLQDELGAADMSNQMICEFTCCFVDRFYIAPFSILEQTHCTCM